MTRSACSSRLPRLTDAVTIRTSLSRRLHTSSRYSAAHNLPMPAMSPTMTEGNITSWKVHEGDNFTAGDVLLEIETDKAQMDVEAQDDGVMAKIIEHAGAKGVKVGARIAITAEEGDDLDSLDLSLLDSQGSISSQDSSTSQHNDGNASAHAPTSTTEQSREPPAKQPSESSKRNPAYPLFPSVLQLLHEQGIDIARAESIPASGPNGRLLKGDVLAYLGAIDSNYANDQAKWLQKISHLDLSNIEKSITIKSPESINSSSNEMTNVTGPQQEASSQRINDVSLQISLEEVVKVRDKVHKVLGIDIAVETFIARAIELCNHDLPLSKSRKPTNNELFDAVLGLEGVNMKSSGPTLVPWMQSSETLQENSSASRQGIADIIDELSAPLPLVHHSKRIKVAKATNSKAFMFTVAVPTGDETRGKVFLQRFKTALQVEPGKLIL